MNPPDEIPTDWLARAAAAHPRRTAVRDAAGATLSWRELFGRARGLAPALAGEAEDGGPGVIELEPGLEHAVCLHACMLGGIAAQTLRPGLPEAERRRALAGAGLHLSAEWLAAREPSEPAAAPAPPAPVPGAILSRVLTSGTSGEAHAVDLTFANHYASAVASAARLGSDPGELWLCCLPLDHVGGLTILVRSAIAGTACEIHPRFDTERVAECLERRATAVSLVPTQLGRLLEAGADLSRLRFVLVGGAPIPPPMLAEALARDAPIAPTYGLTEACSQVCTLDPAAARRGEEGSGPPLPGISVGLAEDGEITVAGPTVAPGCAGVDGRFRTGDLGRFDERGSLHVGGRADDLIVSGGENVRPEEVEDVLLAHPAVAEAGVWGEQDPEWGQTVRAKVVPGPGMSVSERELLAHCKGRLAGYKAPKSIEFAAELPRTRSGKLRRGLLGRRGRGPRGL